MDFGLPRERLIVALDLPGAEALQMAHELQGVVSWLKVGMTLFYEEGPEIIVRLRDLGFRIFLDLKLNDIPHQVGLAARAVSGLGVEMLTVHASGGAAMVEAAVRGAQEGAAEAGTRSPAVIAVTVLTSMNDASLAALGIERPVVEQVPILARVAAAGSAAGVVCSPFEAAAMRGLLGEDALVVTPGVRPAGADVGDQARVATPFEALSSGASHLVVGRPVTAAASPVHAAQDLIAQMEGAEPWPIP